MTHENDWMTVKEVAFRTGHSRQWVHQRLHDGTFRHERKGRRIDVHGGSVHLWMLSQVASVTLRLQHLNNNLPYRAFEQ